MKKSNSRLLATHRRGFTLVELLIVILIILILAGIMLGGLSGALHEAKIQRTQAQIARLHAVMLGKWESFRTRRVPLAVGGPDAASRKIRVDAIRELMRMELPDRITDVTDAPGVSGLQPTATQRAYQRKIQALQTATGKTWNVPNQGSECLYLILSQPSDDGSSPIEFFADKEIGDTDGDGVPEVLDGWGVPIAFLRWAPGFVSPLQPAPVGNPGASLPATDPSPKNYDTFDPLFVYDNASAPAHYTLFPLIYSAGPDGVHDIYSDTFKNTSAPQYHYSQTNSPANPYVVPDASNAPGLMFGSPIDGNADGLLSHKDNIHNHLLDIGR